MANKLTDEQIIERLKQVKAGDKFVGIVTHNSGDITEGKVYEVKLDTFNRLIITYDNIRTIGRINCVSGYEYEVFSDLRSGFLSFYDEPKETHVFELNNTKWRNNNKRVGVHVVTDQAGLYILRALQESAIKLQTIAELEKQRNELDKKIQKLKGENK